MWHSNHSLNHRFDGNGTPYIEPSLYLKLRSETAQKGAKATGMKSGGCQMLLQHHRPVLNPELKRKHVEWCAWNMAKKNSGNNIGKEKKHQNQAEAPPWSNIPPRCACAFSPWCNSRRWWKPWRNNFSTGPLCLLVAWKGPQFPLYNLHLGYIWLHRTFFSTKLQNHRHEGWKPRRPGSCKAQENVKHKFLGEKVKSSGPMGPTYHPAAKEPGNPWWTACTPVFAGMRSAYLSTIRGLYL